MTQPPERDESHDPTTHRLPAGGWSDADAGSAGSRGQEAHQASGAGAGSAGAGASSWPGQPWGATVPQAGGGYGQPAWAPQGAGQQQSFAPTSRPRNPQKIGTILGYIAAGVGVLTFLLGFADFASAGRGVGLSGFATAPDLLSFVFAAGLLCAYAGLRRVAVAAVTGAALALAGLLIGLAHLASFSGTYGELSTGVAYYLALFTGLIVTVIAVFLVIDLIKPTGAGAQANLPGHATAVPGPAGQASFGGAAPHAAAQQYDGQQYDGQQYGADQYRQGYGQHQGQYGGQQYGGQPTQSPYGQPAQQGYGDTQQAYQGQYGAQSYGGSPAEHGGQGYPPSSSGTPDPGSDSSGRTPSWGPAADPSGQAGEGAGGGAHDSRRTDEGGWGGR